jgi:hypothetical protein
MAWVSSCLDGQVHILVVDNLWVWAQRGDEHSTARLRTRGRGRHPIVSSCLDVDKCWIRAQEGDPKPVLDMCSLWMRIVPPLSVSVTLDQERTNAPTSPFTVSTADYAHPMTWCFIQVTIGGVTVSPVLQVADVAAQGGREWQPVEDHDPGERHRWSIVHGR